MDKRKRNKAVKRIIGAGIAALIGFGIYTAVKPEPMVYEKVKAETKDLTTWYSFSGNIEANNREMILAEAAFVVDEIYVEKGEMVEAGTELLDAGRAGDPEAAIEGEIAEIFVKENEAVSPGMQLMSIVDYSDLEVSVKVDEYELSALSVDKAVDVRINALDKSFSGVVKSISKEGTIINGVTYFIAVVKLDYDASLKVGMSAEVTLVKEQVKGVVTLPMKALQFHDDNTVYVLKDDAEGGALEIVVKTGINDGISVAITEGVKEGETVLLPPASPWDRFAMSGPPERNGDDGDAR